MVDTENLKSCLKNKKNTSFIKKISHNNKCESGNFRGNGSTQPKTEILNLEFDNPLLKLPRGSENLNLGSRNKRRIPKIQNYIEPYVNKTFKTNKKTLKALNDLSVSIHSEMDTEFCVDENGNGSNFSFTTDNNPKSVSPVDKKLQCNKTFNVHTHPTIKGNPLTGKSELSMNDKVYYLTRLYDSNDNLACGCAIGEDDRKINCLCNIKKLMKDEKIDEIKNFEKKI